MVVSEFNRDVWRSVHHHSRKLVANRNTRLKVESPSMESKPCSARKCLGHRRHHVTNAQKEVRITTQHNCFTSLLYMRTKTVRLDFRRSLVSGLPSRGRSAGSFPEQRLVIEPIKPFDELGILSCNCTITSV